MVRFARLTVESVARTNALTVDAEPTYRRVGFSLYGLPAKWPGPRWVGGWSFGSSAAQPGPVVFSLAHGGPWDSPTLRVNAFLPAVWPPSELASDLAVELELFESPPGGGDGQWYAEAEARARQMAEPISFLVDGREVAFQLLQHADDWQAWSADDGVCVSLDGRGYGGFPIDEVELVTIPDAMPYIEGSRAQVSGKRS